LRILETHPPLQSTIDPRRPLSLNSSTQSATAQALAITGTAKYLHRAKAARTVAKCGAGKTFMALDTFYVLAEGRLSPKPRDGSCRSVAQIARFCDGSKSFSLLGSEDAVDDPCFCSFDRLELF
jgi:hypothetical protein